MTTNNLLIEVMVWGLLGLIAFLFTIPSVSSYLLEKITGIKEEENFDLNGMIKQNEELLKIQAGAIKKSALEVAIALSTDEKLQQLLQEYQWEAGPVTQLVLSSLSEKSARVVEYSEFRAAFKKLYSIDSFEQNLTLDHITEHLLNGLTNTKT